MTIETFTIKVKCEYSIIDIIKLWLIGITVKPRQYSINEIMAMRGRVRK